MSKIALVTDTNASLPAELVKTHGIIEVPIYIQFGEETFITGQTIDDTKLFEMIDARKTLPTTAAPAPADFEKAFKSAFAQGAEQIICICCSSKVSATYDAACLAKDMFPGKDIHVIDSLQLTLAEGFQVLTAAEAAADGVGIDEIVTQVKNLQANTHVFGALPTLKYLAMGGRMGKLAAGFGNTLEIKPILTSNEGKLELLEKVRTWQKAKKRLVELAVENTAGAEIKKIGLFHVNNESGALALHGMLKDALNTDVEPVIAEFTPGLSVHAGSGVIGFVLIT